jgi:uncharacterized spore protein YtfJ
LKLQDLTTTVRDALTTKRVYAEPIEKDGVIIIPAAAVGGGGGAGGGQDAEGQPGEGGGFGLGARPVGAFVVKDGNVAWVPAVDANRILTMLTVLIAILAISRSRVARAKLSAKKAADRQAHDLRAMRASR